MRHICRTCLRYTVDEGNNYVSLNRTQVGAKVQTIKDKLITCVPELSLHGVSEPKICGFCLAALQLAYEFKRRCLQTENQIKTFIQHTKPPTSFIELKDIVEYNYQISAKNDYNAYTNIIFDKPEHEQHTNLKNDLGPKHDIKVQFDSDPLQIDNLSSSSRDATSACSKQLSTQASDTYKEAEDFTRIDPELVIVKTEADDFEEVQDEAVENDTENPDFHQILVPAVSMDNPYDTSNVPEPVQDQQGIRTSVNNVITYTCTTCTRPFASKMALRNHRLVHDGERPYICKICQKGFNNNSNLHRHVKTQHSGERPYACDICFKTFTQNVHRVSHMRTHSGEKPFKCEICDKRFSHANVLRTHVRTHSGIKPYSCEVCDKSFNQREHLKLHIRTHANETPFRCEVCNKEFRHANLLKSHLRIHYGNMAFQCDVCNETFNHSEHLAQHMCTHDDSEQVDHKFESPETL